MTEFLMPKLGADMSSGTLVEWRKKPGDTVHRGDVVAAVETDKGVIDIEIFHAGVIDKLLVQPGQSVPVGAPLALLRGDGETGPTIASTATIAQAEQTAPPLMASALQPTQVTPVPTWTAEDVARLRISPSARQLARELRVDPRNVKGTGLKGAITREDIQHAAADKQAVQPAPVQPPAPAEERFRRMRQTITAAMTRSKREIPHYYVSTTIDLHSATTWLTEHNSQRAIADRLLLGVLLLKAAALALREVPELNSVWDGDRAVASDAINVGVAISLRHGGLIAPALHHVDQRDLDELMQGFRDLVNRARAGGLRSSELSDSTITVTSLGEQGVETVFGIIYPPQVALVGFGKLVERPWSVQGQIVSRPVITASLSADHRVSDGHRGALYLSAVDRLLQEPSQL
jgi:pyruvate dehydrogenase E2 component (dihydrolipoamide acetyltransferase)